MDIKGVIRGFIDKIFNPPISFLEMAADKLKDVQMVTAQGLDLSAYFSVLGDLPTAWQLVVSSILMSGVLLGTLLIFRTVMRMYIAIKEGVQWW